MKDQSRLAEESTAMHTSKGATLAAYSCQKARFTNLAGTTVVSHR